MTLVAILAVVAALVTVWLSRPERRIIEANQTLRGIHQAMVMHAEGNSGYFPGLDAEGRDVDLRVEARLELLLRANYFTSEYLISPSEAKPGWTTGQTFTSSHYSYAFLQVPTSGARRTEWSSTLHPKAVVGGDRNTGTTESPASVATDVRHPDRSGWRGTVLFNDNHVSWMESHQIDTEYAGHATERDHLFDSTSPDDALLVHSGN